MSLFIAIIITTFIICLLYEKRISTEKKEEPKENIIVKKPPKKEMSAYEIEMYAKYCNAYLARQDREERYKEEQENQKEENQKEKKPVSNIVSTPLKRLQMYNNKFDYMTGEDFELYIGYFLQALGYEDIRLTKGSGDQGVDILAEKSGIRYAVQCKRYSEPVGNKAIQEVFTGKAFYRCDVAMVITNNYFTQSAKELAQATGVVLWDRDFLTKYINRKNIEKRYTRDDDSVIFSLEENNLINVVAVFRDIKSATYAYFLISIYMKEKWSEKFNFCVGIEFESNIAIMQYENGKESFYGKSSDGEIIPHLPDWLDKTRDALIKENQEEFAAEYKIVCDMVDDFMNIVSKNT